MRPDHVHDSVRHQQVGVDVDRFGERAKALHHIAGQAEHRGIGAKLLQHAQAVADAAAGVLGAERVRRAQPVNVKLGRHHAFHLAAEDLGQVAAQPDLVGELIGQPHPVRGEVHVPAVRLVIGQRAVAQDRRRHRLGGRRREQELRRCPLAGGGGRRVHPSVDAEVVDR